VVLSCSDTDCLVRDLANPGPIVHQGPGVGTPPTGRRFGRIEEIYSFQFRDGRIVHARDLKDSQMRLRQPRWLEPHRSGSLLDRASWRCE